MDITGNTILVTGGGSGIGRALADALHDRGNRVIVAGRRLAALEEVARGKPRMSAMRLDIEDDPEIRSFAARLIADHPALDVVIHNAGIMQPEEIIEADTEIAERTVATNLLGPIRLTAALLPHLLTRPKAAIVTVSSGLAFVPYVATPAYSATKAAIHAWSMAIREQLRGTPVEVVEIAPPYVQTELLGPHQATDPDAMPLAEFTAEVMALLEQGPASGEVIVERCKPLRFAARDGTFDAVFAQLNRPRH